MPKDSAPFNPRARLRHPSSRNLKMGPGELEEFVSRSLDFRSGAISFSQFRDELVNWFPLIRNFKNVKIAVDILLPQPDDQLFSLQSPSKSPQISPFAYLIPSTPQPLNSSTAQQLNGSAVENPIATAESPFPYEPRNALFISSRKIKGFWDLRGHFRPNLFKKVLLFRLNSTDTFTFELVDLAAKVIRPDDL